MLTSLVSVVTSCRVEPCRFHISVGRGLPVAWHSTVTGSPILTCRGPSVVSRTLGASEEENTQTQLIHERNLQYCILLVTRVYTWQILETSCEHWHVMNFKLIWQQAFLYNLVANWLCPLFILTDSVRFCKILFLSFSMKTAEMSMW